MSATNGHLPEGATLVTLAQLQAANTKHVKAEALSARLGTDVYVRIRAIRRVAYLQMLPPGPPDAAQWPADQTKEQRLERVNAWLRTLSDDERADRQRGFDDVTYRVVAAGVVEPAMTIEQARDLANDADDIAVAILMFSGLVFEEKPAEVAAAP